MKKYSMEEIQILLTEATTGESRVNVRTSVCQGCHNPLGGPKYVDDRCVCERSLDPQDENISIVCDNKDLVSHKLACEAVGIITQLLTENATLKKQLEVAVKALHKISKCEADTLQGCNVEAKEALEEIKRIGGGE